MNISESTILNFHTLRLAIVEDDVVVVHGFDSSSMQPVNIMCAKNILNGDIQLVPFGHFSNDSWNSDGSISEAVLNDWVNLKKNIVSFDSITFTPTSFGCVVNMDSIKLQMFNNPYEHYVLSNQEPHLIYPPINEKRELLCSLDI